MSIRPPPRWSPRSRFATPRKLGDEGGGGSLVDLARRAALLDPPVVHDRHPVAHRERLLLVVGDVHERDADLALERRRARAGAPCGAWRRGRRAARRAAAPGARRTRARASATRCCWPPESWCGLALRERGEPHQLERLAHPWPAWPPCRHLANRRPKATLSAHRQVREQRVALEDGVDRALLGRHVRDVVAVEQDPPASVGRSNPPIIRSVVVLPQPDGPSSEKNSPGAISRSMPSTATSSPKRFSSSTSVDAPAAGRPVGSLRVVAGHDRPCRRDRTD